jgi:hypothetical protein
MKHRPVRCTLRDTWTKKKMKWKFKKHWWRRLQLFFSHPRRTPGQQGGSKETKLVEEEEQVNYGRQDTTHTTRLPNAKGLWRNQQTNGERKKVESEQKFSPHIPRPQLETKSNQLIWMHPIFAFLHVQTWLHGDQNLQPSCNCSSYANSVGCVIWYVCVL